MAVFVLTQKISSTKKIGLLKMELNNSCLADARKKFALMGYNTNWPTFAVDYEESLLKQKMYKGIQSTCKG